VKIKSLRKRESQRGVGHGQGDDQYI